MTTNEIIRLITLSISLLISLSGLIIAIIKAIKNRKWNDLCSALQNFIIEAEKLTQCNGEEKKCQVLKMAENFCADEGIKFDSQKVEKVIEDLINLTKEVNNKDKPTN